MNTAYLYQLQLYDESFDLCKELQTVDRQESNTMYGYVHWGTSRQNTMSLDIWVYNFRIIWYAKQYCLGNLYNVWYI